VTTAPGSTDETLGLLRELRRRPAGQRAANLVYWLYLAGLLILSYGGWLIATIVRALKHPPPPMADTQDLLRATPAGLCALALLLLALLLWDARWRGPVNVSPPTADWLLGTPVDRGRLLRPRYRQSAVTNTLVGAVAGLVPAALLLAAGLGGATLRHSVALAGLAMLSTGLLAGLGTGAAAWTEAHSATRVIATARSAAGLLFAALAVVAAVAAATTALPATVATVLLWSGPWGWAAQGPVALAGGSAPFWPAATAALAVVAAVALAAGDRVAASVPAAALRQHAHTLGHMSAAMLNMDARRITTTYRDATGAYGRARFGIRPPLHRQLVLLWRDLTALVRSPARLAWSVLLALAAVGLGALAVRSPHTDLLTMTAALVAGYLAAAGLCEGARLDGDDPRRSSQLPFRYDTLAWWHAVVPGLVLVVVAGVPAAVLAAATDHGALIPLTVVTIPVLVGGALVNSFRGELEGEMFEGFDTPLGNSSGVTITLWYLTGPLLAIGPALILWYAAIKSGRDRVAITVVILAALLAAWLGRIAAGRASRLRSH
jgi:Family of unknown function (DUF6297)